MKNFEEISFNAWPSLQTLVYKGSLLRLSNGYTKRANSNNPLYIKDEDITDVIKYSEKIFKLNKIPTVFKIIDDKKYEKIDKALDLLNYEKIDLTHVMTLDLIKHEVLNNNIIVENGFSQGWLNSFFKINDIKMEHRITAKTMLNNIVSEVIVVSIKVDNKIIACGYGAIEEDYIGIFDIIVDKNHRARGYGKSIIKGIINEAIQRNVKIAYLQVVASNEIANSLYKKLGFIKIYDYWYRIKNNN